MPKYFYIKYKNENPDAVIDESIFHYPGPNPWTKEQGVMMLADAVEASSRSLKEITEQVLIDHVNKIVDGIMTDGSVSYTHLDVYKRQVLVWRMTILVRSYIPLATMELFMRHSISTTL